MKYIKSRIYNNTSRYCKCRQIVDGNNIYLETFDENNIPISNDDKYHIVTLQQIGRFDIIAKEYYNNPSLSWVIMLANDIIDPFIVKAGSMLRIPSIMTLYKNKGVLHRNG